MHRGVSHIISACPPSTAEVHNYPTKLTRLPGLGLAIAKHLLTAPRSSNLVILARSKEPLQQLKDQYKGQVEVLSGDLSDLSFGQKAVDLAISAFGRLDGVVINHGILGPVGKIAEADLEAWKGGFDVNYLSAVAFVSTIVQSFWEGYLLKANNVSFISI